MTDAPNILLIVADDLGFTDLGAFGGEIATPNLDRLAYEGVRLTNLHSAPTCSPTRAMLLSGVDHHLAGMGTMTEDIVDNQVGKPGYEGYLNDRVFPLPHLLRQGGYRTYLSGKWHLGSSSRALPFNNGFSRTFSLLDGGASHLNHFPMVGPGEASYSENGEYVPAPASFYSTRYFTERMIDFIRADAADERPFFAYLAFSAPHWPLQAPQASIRKQAGNYAYGYEALYKQRLERLEELRLVDSRTVASARKAFFPPWDELDEEEKRTKERLMEIYAAMVSDMDRYIGHLLAAVEELGIDDDTIVIFLSDNGPEGNVVDAGWEQLTQWIASCCDNAYENMGAANSYLWLGANWAKAIAGPVGRYKGWTHQGGVRVPGIFYDPRAKDRGSIDRTLLSVMDIYPTILELAGLSYPSSGDHVEGYAELQGQSWSGVLARDEASIKDLNDRVLAWELFGKRAVRKGPWKLIAYPPPHGDGAWQLYNLESDPTETKNIAAQHPQTVAELAMAWDAYATKNGVVMPDKPLLY